MKHFAAHIPQEAGAPFLSLQPDPKDSKRHMLETLSVGIAANIAAVAFAMQSPAFVPLAALFTVLNISYMNIFHHKRSEALSKRQDLHLQGRYLLIVEWEAGTQTPPKTTALSAKFARLNQVERPYRFSNNGGPCIELISGDKTIDVGYFLTRPELDRAESRIRHALLNHPEY